MQKRSCRNVQTRRRKPVRSRRAIRAGLAVGVAFAGATACTTTTIDVPPGALPIYASGESEYVHVRSRSGVQTRVVRDFDVIVGRTGRESGEARLEGPVHAEMLGEDKVRLTSRERTLDIDLARETRVRLVDQRFNHNVPLGMLIGSVLGAAVGAAVTRLRRQCQDELGSCGDTMLIGVLVGAPIGGAVGGTTFGLATARRDID